MREILFRGKDLTGAWHYGVPLVFSEELVFITAPHENNRAVITETVGQYTGLTDKNGTKIFEGDIILFEDECPGNYEYHDATEMRVGAILYGDGMFYITNRIAVEMSDLIYDEKIDGVVIGNVHDNPELLEGGVE